MAKAQKRTIPLAAMEKLIRKAGADRVSEGAKVALKEALEEFAEDIITASIKFASHAGRETVKQEDIKLATKHLYT